MEGNSVKIFAKVNDEMKVECKAGEFVFVLDGADSSAPTKFEVDPMQMLLSALGACECYVAGAIAKLNKIDLQDIKIEIEGEKALRESHEKTIRIGYSKITTKFHIKANNTEDEIRRFASLIEKYCPIHATLENSPSFETEVYFD